MNWICTEPPETCPCICCKYVRLENEHEKVKALLIEYAEADEAVNAAANIGDFSTELDRAMDCGKRVIELGNHYRKH